MSDEQIIEAVSSVGFPIVVAFYLLVRVQTSMDRFSSRLEELLLELRRGRLASAD